MLKKIICLSLAICFTTAYAIMPIHTPVVIKRPEKCKTLNCVRMGIDSIDQQMVELIGLRLAYVKRAGELKKQKNAPVHDAAREQAILTTVHNAAEKDGYSGDIAETIFKTILAESNDYEMQFSG